MKPRRKDARRPPAARHPRKRPTIEAILAERGIVRATLAGIPKRDRDDVEEQVLMGAWHAIRRGKYRPDPKAEPRAALRAWLHGITWRQAGKYFEAAYTRSVILDPQPLGSLVFDANGPLVEAYRDRRCFGTGWADSEDPRTTLQLRMG